MVEVKEMIMKRIHGIASLMLLMLMGGCIGLFSTPLAASTQASISRTATFTVTPMPVTMTSINTPQALSAQEADAQVFGLLKNNSECKLPCLWGLTPGK